MPSLRDQMERVAQGFVPTGDWLEGAIQGARRRQRRRRVLTAVVALAVFAASFTWVWVALRPPGDRYLLGFPHASGPGARALRSGAQAASRPFRALVSATCGR